jgi:hypothetical protein
MGGLNALTKLGRTNASIGVSNPSTESIHKMRSRRRKEADVVWFMYAVPKSQIYPITFSLDDGKTAHPKEAG